VRIMITACTLALTLASLARAEDVDWKVYGSVPIPVNQGGSVCFYEANGIVRTADKHLRVWTKCLAQKDLDAVDTKGEAGRKIVENATRKVIAHYVPPIALIDDIDSDQATAVIRYEETANIGGIPPQAQFFYEFNCPELMMRRLSAYVPPKRRNDKPTAWEHIPPEGTGARLSEILCPQR
jgi:hypothetical protein